MKITNDQYAKLLYEASKTSSESEKKALVSGVANLIKQNSDLAKLNDIENRYQLIKQKESGELKGTVLTANELDNDQLDKIRKAVADSKNISSRLIILKNEVDSEMKGGFVVKFENEILDGSLDSKIARVKKALIS